MVKRDREQDHRYTLARMLGPGMAVLDVGANIGYYSIMMGKYVGDAGKIYAIEPAPFNYDLLNSNVRLNAMEGLVETFHMGMSDKRGTEQLYLSNKSNCHTFVPNSGESGLTETVIEVTMMGICDFASGKRPIDLIRMDIEGFEVEVLNGLLQCLDDSAFKPMLLIETHRPRYDDQSHDMRSVLEKLFSAGYSAKYVVSESHRAKRAFETYQSLGYPESNIEAELEMADRAIYLGIKNEDLPYLVCDTDFVRGVLLTRNS